MQDKIGTTKDRTCPKCGQEGEFAGARQWHLGKSRRWENDFKCKACGTEWRHPAKD